MGKENEKVCTEIEVIKIRKQILGLRNIKNEMKDAIKSINSSLKQKKGSVTLNIGHLKYSSQKRIKQKERKRVKKTYRNYGMPSRETICILLESCKEKTGKKGQKAY